MHTPMRSRDHAPLGQWRGHVLQGCLTNDKRYKSAACMGLQESECTHVEYSRADKDWWVDVSERTDETMWGYLRRSQAAS